MEVFSAWINANSPIDLQLSGATFTWSNYQSPPTKSRHDRFLVPVDWLDMYPKVYQMALTKLASNHCPILLDYRYERWGLSPFRFELMCLKEQHFPTMGGIWWKKKNQRMGGPVTNWP